MGPRRSLRLDWFRAPAAVALLATLVGTRPALAFEGDSTTFLLELGQRSEVTNEQYVDYAELFVDSALVGARARLTSLPERRFGGLIATGFAGTRNDGATRYRIDSETLVGDLLSSARLDGSWRSDTESGWRWQVDPNAEFRQDRTFDRDRREWRAALGTRLRRVSADGTWAGEWRARGDLLRVSGNATDLLTDRQTLVLGSALERLGLLGEWRVAYALAVRAFPDSSSRDHLEHQLETGARTVIPGGHVLAFELRGARRQAGNPGPISRDEFMREEANVEVSWLASPTWGATLGCEGEAIQYDRPDSSVYADAQRLRTSLRLHMEPRAGATVRIEALLERGWCHATPEEEYVELAAGPGLDWFGAGAWWDIAPRVGRRWPANGGPPIPGYAGGYEFYELSLAADQPIGPGVRFRLNASGRIEEHDDPSLDARSLFVSAEIRWRVLGLR